MPPIRRHWLASVASFIWPGNCAVRRLRNLHAEFLERRCVLSVAPLESETLSLEAYVAAEHEMGPVEPTAIEDAPASEPLSPSAVDRVLDGGATGDAGQVTLNEDVAEGEESTIGVVIGQDLPPQIVMFSAVIVGDELVISGRVIDDHDLTLCHVTIWGLVEQPDLSVNAAGDFEFSTAIPGVSDYIYAVANDGYHDSNIVNTYFMI